jgi:methylthioribose-1-phosphate isomerase
MESGFIKRENSKKNRRETSILTLIKPLQFEQDKLIVLDQTLLPTQEKWVRVDSVEQLILIIQNLSIRGAPLLGLAGIYGLYYAAKQAKDFQEFTTLATQIREARPTAVNLSKLIDIELSKYPNNQNFRSLQDLFLADANNYEKELENESIKLSEYGSTLIQPNECILTHCNTGSLATIGPGTALGVIKYAHQQGKNITVLFTETRPLMQGARLTSYELTKANISCSMIIDHSVGFFMQQNKINKVIVGADRIASNGDTANKIGTYSIAVLAHENNVPFYIAAPTSTFDSTIKTAKEIMIEYRKPTELNSYVLDCHLSSINPAFDITPKKYITGFITEKGIFLPSALK